MLKNKLFIFIILLALAGIGALILQAPTIQKSPKNSVSPKVRVVTSLYPMQFFVERIGGERVEVYNLTPPGAEPHDYEPTAQDIIAIEHADLLVLNGYIEPWTEKLQTDTPVVAAGKGLFMSRNKEEKEILQDPHVWLDPVLAQQEISTISKALADIDPLNAIFYQGNAGTLITEFDQINAMFQQGLETCERRDFITSHAAFGYLAARYDLKQISVAGLSPEEEPSAKQLAEIMDFAREKNITHIFFETLASPKLSETIAQEIGAQTLVLNPLEGLATEEKLNGENYFTIMRQNLANLRTALQCS